MHLTPITDDHALAAEWFDQFEGAGLDGLIAKDPEGTYQPDKRVMTKIKHERTADCVVAGYRVHKSGPDAIGSLLLGLYQADGHLASVGVIGAFPMARRGGRCSQRCSRWSPRSTTTRGRGRGRRRATGRRARPRRAAGTRTRTSRSSPLRPERVVEVRYDYMEGVRFRHTAQFVRWRPDREPSSCTYEQLEQPVTFDLAEVLGLSLRRVARELAAGGGDLPAAGVAHGAGDPGRLDPPHELVLAPARRGVPLRCPAWG